MLKRFSHVSLSVGASCYTQRKYQSAQQVTATRSRNTTDDAKPFNDGKTVGGKRVRKPEKTVPRGGNRNWRAQLEHTKTERANRAAMMEPYETALPSLDLFVPYSKHQWERAATKPDTNNKTSCGGAEATTTTTNLKDRQRQCHGHFVRFNYCNRSVQLNRYAYRDEAVSSSGGSRSDVMAQASAALASLGGKLGTDSVAKTTHTKGAQGNAEASGSGGSVKKKKVKRVVQGDLMRRSCMRLNHHAAAKLLYVVNACSVAPPEHSGCNLFQAIWRRGGPSVITPEPVEIVGKTFTLGAQWVEDKAQTEDEKPKCFLRLTGTAWNETLTIEHKMSPDPDAIEVEYQRSCPPPRNANGTLDMVAITNRDLRSNQLLGKDGHKNEGQPSANADIQKPPHPSVLSLLPPHLQDVTDTGVMKEFISYKCDTWPIPAIEIRDAGQLVALQQFLESAIMSVFTEKPTLKKGRRSKMPAGGAGGGDDSGDVKRNDGDGM